MESPEARAGFRRRILPRGTILFRASDSLRDLVPDRIATQANLCTDTGKRGLYFATYPFLSMAIATEYQRDMLLGVFEVQEDIIAADGKYQFRKLILPNGVQTIEDLGKIPDPLPEKYNINHFDPLMLPILYEVGGHENMTPLEFKPHGWAGELFVANAADRAKIKMIQKYIIRFREVPEISKELDFMVYADEWGSSEQWLQFLKVSDTLEGVEPEKQTAVGDLKGGGKKKYSASNWPNSRGGTKRKRAKSRRKRTTCVRRKPTFAKASR